MKLVKKSGIIKNTAICIVVIGAGFFLMTLMGKMKEPPVEKKIAETPLQVEIMKVEKQDVRISISAFGEVTSLNSVTISPEVSGLITEIHTKLEVGEIIPEGDVLFRIDATDYETDFTTYTVRKKALLGNMKLAEKEFARVKKLYEKNNTGTLADVEAAERAINSANDNLAQVSKLLKDTQKNLERCTITAPFNARIKSSGIEKGEFAVAGTGVLTIADDSVLEVIVPVDTSEALMVLDFEEETPQAFNTSWFSRLNQTECSIVWAESGNAIKADGFLHRVVKYDSASRTVSLAVRINKNNSQNAGNPSFPIVDGMFCQVIIPGRVMKNVIRVPEHAVSYDGQVRIASKSRLKTVPVNVIWKSRGYSLISVGLKNGDQLITTRLNSPLENLLLDVTRTDMVADTGV